MPVIIERQLNVSCVPSIIQWIVSGNGEHSVGAAEHVE